MKTNVQHTYVRASSIMRFILFFTTVLLLTFLMHWVIYRQMRFAFQIPPNVLWFKFTMLFLAIWYLGSVILTRSVPSSFSELNLKFASYWLGFAVYLFLFGVAVEILTGLGLIIHLPKLLNTSFTLFRQSVSSIGIVVAILISLWAIFVARGDFVIKQKEFHLTNLSPELSGTKIILVSDIHSGSVNRVSFVKRVVHAINARKPDIVLIPGDLADGDPFRLIDKLAPFENVNSTYGVFWSFGNHEFYTGIETVKQALSSKNVTLLQNNWKLIADGKLVIAGVNDPTDREFGGKGMLIEEAIPDTISVPVLLLAHQPLLVEKVFEKGVSLMVCGHTHGGQTWPANYIVDRVWKYPRGAFEIGKGLLYVSVGVGTWGPPMRLSQPPEIIEITLRKK